MNPKVANLSTTLTFRMMYSTPPRHWHPYHHHTPTQRLPDTGHWPGSRKQHPQFMETRLSKAVERGGREVVCVWSVCNQICWHPALLKETEVKVTEGFVSITGVKHTILFFFELVDMTEFLFLFPRPLTFSQQPDCIASSEMSILYTEMIYLCHASNSIPLLFVTAPNIVPGSD